MSETTFRNLLVAGVIFAMIIAGVFSMVYMVENGSVGQNSSGDKVDAVAGFIQQDKLTAFNRSFNRMDTTVTQINDVSEDLKNAQVGSSNFATLALAFVSTTWNSVKVVFGMFGFVGDIFGGLTAWIADTTGGANLGWIIKYVGALVGIVVIFGVISYIFGRNE